MKTWNVNPIDKKFSFGNMKAVVLGCRGNDCYESIVPYEADEIVGMADLKKSLKNRPKIVVSDDPERWLAIVSAKSDNHNGKENAYGSVYCFPNEQNVNVKVIEKGHAAYGEDRNNGVFFEYLLVVDDETLLKIRPVGKNNVIYWLYFTANEVLTMSNEEVESQFGIETNQKLLDLNNIPLYDSY